MFYSFRFRMIPPVHEPFFMAHGGIVFFMFPIGKICNPYYNYNQMGYVLNSEKHTRMNIVPPISMIIEGYSWFFFCRLYIYISLEYIVQNCQSLVGRPNANAPSKKKHGMRWPKKWFTYPFLQDLQVFCFKQDKCIEMRLQGHSRGCWKQPLALTLGFPRRERILVWLNHNWFFYANCHDIPKLCYLIGKMNWYDLIKPLGLGVAYFQTNQYWCWYDSCDFLSLWLLLLLYLVVIILIICYCGFVWKFRRDTHPIHLLIMIFHCFSY